MNYFLGGEGGAADPFLQTKACTFAAHSPHVTKDEAACQVFFILEIRCLPYSARDYTRKNAHGTVGTKTTIPMDHVVKANKLTWHIAPKLPCQWSHGQSCQSVSKLNGSFPHAVNVKTIDEGVAYG